MFMFFFLWKYILQKVSLEKKIYMMYNFFFENKVEVILKPTDTSIINVQPKGFEPVTFGEQT